MEVDELTRLRLEIDDCRRELKASRSELEQFTHSVAHDLLAPLNRVSSSCQVLLEDYPEQLDQTARDWIESAIHHVEETQRRVVALRKLSAVITDAQPTEPINAVLIFQEVLAGREVQREQAAATVTCSPLGWIRADRDQFHCLLDNLIDNALKFVGDHNLIVEVGIAALPPDRLSQLLEMNAAIRQQLYYVRDNGIGIRSQDLERVFFPFQQLQPTANRSGDGIGLALCRRIAKRHGGTIWAESTLGTGSVFYFTMPVL